jgi:hypothetical protein
MTILWEFGRKASKRAAGVIEHLPGSFGYAQDRLLDSAPSSAVSHDKSVRRSAQDDDFVGVSKASGRGHLPSFIHPTRKLVVIEIAEAT